MNVVGLDLSLTSTGVCMVDENGSWTVSTVKSSGSADDDLPTRRDRIDDLVLDICHDLDKSYVVVEGPSFGHSRQRGEHMRAGLWWAVMINLRWMGSTVVEIPPSVLKKYSTGRGNASKDQVLAAAIRRYPHVNITGNDEADATILAAIGMRLLRTPVEESLPQTHLAALDKVKLP